MATKRQRLAQKTLGGEPTLTLREFSRSLAAPPPAADCAAPEAGCLSTVAESYLVYCYMCRTGLWQDVSLRMSACGAFYLACEPCVFKVPARAGAPASQPSLAAPDAAAAGPAAGEAAARDEAGEADDDEADDDDDMSSSAGEEDDEDADAAAADGAAAPEPVADTDGGGAGAVDAAAAAAAPRSSAAAAVEERRDAAAGVEEEQTFRVRTLTVPVSVANAAPCPDRMQQLLRISDVEGGAPVSLALVDSDGTVIVAHIMPGLVPPEVLQRNEGDEGDEEEDECLPATILPEDEAAAADAGAGASAGGAGAQVAPA